MSNLPANQVKLARDNVGIEIMLNTSGYRKQINSNTDLAKSEDHKCGSVIDESIPLKCRQNTYDKKHSCV